MIEPGHIDMADLERLLSERLETGGWWVIIAEDVPSIGLLSCIVDLVGSQAAEVYITSDRSMVMAHIGQEKLPGEKFARLLRSVGSQVVAEEIETHPLIWLQHGMRH